MRKPAILSITLDRKNHAGDQYVKREVEVNTLAAASEQLAKWIPEIQGRYEAVYFRVRFDNGTIDGRYDLYPDETEIDFGAFIIRLQQAQYTKADAGWNP